MIVIKVNYTTDQPIIKVNYDDAPIYISTSVDATYINVDYGTGGGGGGGAIWGDIIGNLSDQLDLQAALDAKVPYTGATANVDLGEYELKAGQIELDQSPTGTAGVAVTRWNDTIGSTETTLKGGNVILKNGVDLVARVVNKVTPNTTLTKASYQAVKVSGAQGQRLAVALAQANNDNNSADTLGLVIETIATNQEGFIMTVGNLEGINTTGSLQGETWADGDVLYLSPTTPGAITNIKPNGSTGHIVVIGYVEYAHANNGKIYVKIMNGWELDELHNVFISSPSNNDALIYESSTSLWKNKSIATALGYTPGTVSSVALSVPTGLVITSGSPITTSGTIAVGLQSGYAIPTTVKQSNWDDAYTFVSAFPSQTGNSGKYLTTDGSTLSWGTVSTANIYNSDGTLTGNRTVTMGSFTLSFDKDITVSGLSLGRGRNLVANNIVLGTNSLNNVSLSGQYNTAIGQDNLSANTTGNLNIAIGFEGLRNNTTGAQNIAIGYNALTANSISSFNVAIGVQALLVSTGAFNTAVGSQSLISVNANSNTALGCNTLRHITTGGENVAIGHDAGRYFGTGTSFNTNSTGSIYLGFRTRASASGNSNEIVVGYNTVGLGSNTTVIGNSSTTDTAIYGRMLVNYGTPVIGTYALDVNGTGRFNAATSGVAYTVEVRDTNSTSGTSLLLNYNNGTSTILQSRSAGFRIYSDNSKNFLGFNFSSGNIVLGGTEADNSTDRITVHGLVSSSTNDGVGISLWDTGVSVGYGVGYNFSGNGKIIASIRSTINSGFNNTGLRFIVGNNTGVLTEVFRITETQNVLIGSTTNVPSAILAATSTTKGFLPPRMTAAQKTAISTPATGLVIYQTDSTEGLYQYKSTGWEAIGGGGGGTPAGSNTQIQYNNSGAFGASANLIWDNTNTRLGVGTGNPSTTLQVNGNALVENSANIERTLTISNSFNGNNSSANLILSSDASSGSSQVFKYASGRNAYKFISASDFGHYNGTAGGDISLLNDFATGKIKFGAGGSSTAQATLFSTGNFIIGGTTDAGYKCDVQGTFRASSNIYITGGSAANGSIYYTNQYGIIINGISSAISDFTITSGGGGIAATLSSGSFTFNSYAKIGGLFVGGDTNNAGNIRLSSIYGVVIRGAASSTYHAGISESNGINGLWMPSDGSIKIGAYNSTYNSSAILEAVSTTKGFLPPRMTETQKNAISTPATGLVIYQTDGTEGLYQYKSTGWSQVAGTGGGGGISRSVNVISTTTTAGASASTDYVYLISGTTTLTLPTAVGNTNRYTLKNVGTNTVTINTTSSQTIDGSTSITMAVQYTALDVISDGTNWNII